MDLDNKIFFIGGSGRSGTTILRRLLGTQLGVLEIPEWRFLLDPDGLLDFSNGLEKSWTPALYDRKLKRLKSLLCKVQSNSGFINIYRRLIYKLGLSVVLNRYLDVAYGAVDVNQLCPSFNKHVQEMTSSLVGFSYNSVWTGSHFLENNNMYFLDPIEINKIKKTIGNFYLEIILDALENSGNTFYLEKNTWTPLVFDQLLGILPGAKMIAIFRDPVDVISSMMRQRWSPNEFEKAVYYYKGIMQQWLKVKRVIPPDSFLEISYEQLISNSTGILRGIEEFSTINIDLPDNFINNEGIGKGYVAFTNDQLKYISVNLEDEIRYHQSL